MKTFSLIFAMFCLSACQGAGDDPDTIWQPGDAPAEGEGGKADGELDCAELKAEIARLDEAGREGRAAARRRAQLAKRLALLEESGACEPVPEEVVPVVQGGCGFDQDGNGLLSVEELLAENRLDGGAEGSGGSRQRREAECAAEGGVVRCPARRIHIVRAPAQDSKKSGTAGRPTFPGIFPPELMDRLLDILLEWIRRLGIHENEYDAETYDCDNFADDLERALEELGPGVGTFTYMACDWDEATGNYLSAHALTDVHLFGSLFWVEPQTAQIADLDGNGDGKVNYVTDFSTYPTATEDNEDPHKRCFIAVFDSAAAAEAAGLELD